MKEKIKKSSKRKRKRKKKRDFWKKNGKKNNAVQIAEEVEGAQDLTVVHPVAQQAEKEETTSSSSAAAAPETHKLRIERHPKASPPIQHPEPQAPKRESSSSSSSSPQPTKSQTPTNKSPKPSKSPKNVPAAKSSSPEVVRTPSPVKEPVAAEVPAETKSSESSSEVIAQGAGGFCNTEGMTLLEKNQLMVTIMKSLVTDEGFAKFKQYSGKYRSGELTAKEYYDHFFILFGKSEQTRELFSLLASLLPDPEKRMELLQLHTINCAPKPAFRRPETVTESPVSVQPKPQKKNKNKKNKGNKETPGVSTAADDVVEHATSIPAPAQTAEKEEFPSLPQSTVVTPTTTAPRQKQQKSKKQKGKPNRKNIIEEIPEGIEDGVTYMKVH